MTKRSTSRRDPCNSAAAVVLLLLAFCVPAGSAEVAPGVHGEGAGDAVTPPADPAAPAPETIDPQAELDWIADLLIDGCALEAKAAAEALLAIEKLPEQAEKRARHLLAKAEERLPPPPPEPPPPPPPFPVAVFDVLQAKDGTGFAAGEAGSLRFHENGISFVPRGEGRAAWDVAWSRVQGLEAAEGLWDAPHPLVLRERGGPPRFLAPIDDDGSFTAPDRLLSAYGRARREARARRQAAARPTDGSTRKERRR